MGANPRTLHPPQPFTDCRGLNNYQHFDLLLLATVSWTWTIPHEKIGTNSSLFITVTSAPDQCNGELAAADHESAEADCSKVGPTVDDIDPAWPNLHYTTIIPRVLVYVAYMKSCRISFIVLP